MEITDPAGDKIVVTDLKPAIMHADDSRRYRMDNPSKHRFIFKLWGRQVSAVKSME
ncbi:hypothetical protein ACEN9X_14315 [Mucilaginibacter sp. Mucisp86]|jgi:hypothetical protein|uniref:hypothetical protein n=1 Tax=Mucilaginibacter sp. Mucisp86 TaxID=3243060 RepID=UPI0039B5865F